MQATLSHYRILEQIGAGGMGVVYRAHDERLDRDVALKVLPPAKLIDQSAHTRFRKEALALSKLNHPNIATVFDFDAQEGMEFLVEELIEGLTLGEMVASGPLAEGEVVTLGSQVAQGLAAAHEHGVIHRDLKPSNILVTTEGRLKIVDFGLAQILQPATSTTVTASETDVPSFAGTIPYMAPEQLSGKKVDARTDIHGAGAVLYEMATGERPFANAKASELIGAILCRPPPPPRTINPRLSPQLERIICKCLEKEPDRRYQSANELAIDLRRFQSGLSVAARTNKGAAFLRRSLSLRSLVALVAVTIVLGLIGAFLIRRSRSESPHISGIAVLPLANLSGDSSQDYFSDGVTEAIITDLGKISGIRVISRQSVMRFKGGNKALPQIGDELGVDALIEGGVVRNRGRVRITVQLVALNPERNLWAASYEREAADIIGVQREIADAVTRELRPAVSRSPSRQDASAINPQAYEMYLRGREQLNRFHPEGMLQAVRYLEQAIALDPKYAPAHASLAIAYAQLGFLSGIPRNQASQQSKNAAVQALALDDGLAEAHVAAAYAEFLFDWDWQGPEAEFRRALELNPNSVDGHLLYSLYLTLSGRFDEAISENRVAIRLDPLNPFVNVNLGWTYLLAKRYAEGISFMRELQRHDPDYPWLHHHLALLYAGQGKCTEALEEVAQSGTLDDYWPYALCNKPEVALKVLDQAKDLADLGKSDPMYPAQINATLGRADEAFRWLDRAIDERSVQVVFIRVAPELDRIRSDPRFAVALRRVGIR